MGRNTNRNKAIKSATAKAAEAQEDFTFSESQLQKIKDVVAAFPHLDKIYLNKRGEWHFNKVEGFVEYDAADFGGGTVGVTDEDEAADAEGTEEI